MIPKEKRNEEKKNLIMNKKLIFIVLASIILLITAFNFRSQITHIFVSKKTSVQTKEPWLTIFTHGTFGCILGLFNFFEVVQDKIPGTQYKKVISKMRKNPFFYQNQPILQKGLIKVKPSFAFG